MPHANQRDVAVADIALTSIEGEPRARDLDLAERLGLTRHRDIRKLIERNLPEIESFGTCATVAHVVRGNPVKEYWLTEEQALLVAMLSDAEKAPAVRHMLIKVFVAWRKGQLTGNVEFDQSVRTMLGGMIKRNAGVVVREALAPVQAELAEAKQEIAELRDKIESPLTCSANDLWAEELFPALKGGTVWLGNRLIEMGCLPEYGSRTKLGGRWRRLFDAGRARIAMKNGLRLLTERYIAERQGQGKLKI